MAIISFHFIMMVNEGKYRKIPGKSLLKYKSIAHVTRVPSKNFQESVGPSASDVALQTVGCKKL